MNRLEVTRAMFGCSLKNMKENLRGVGSFKKVNQQSKRILMNERSYHARGEVGKSS